ncbi:hypothetical protein ZIOFF_032086 [Zingiber officinale]|uniref:Monogalactosyldiacylglycerol synthase n=1 Tax=Zingiber officinale TaxID=94328 RepID=A0A8J5GHT1_ZINOF|nr:hypothetical protein ZIOFF_032086 [Zingiber officinale]
MGEAKDNDVYEKELLDYEEEEEKAPDSVAAKVSGEAVKNEPRAPIGFASAGLSNDKIRPEDESPLIAEDNDAPINGVAEYERPKKVLILMSDTGGGHRASAEAIRAAFNQEFGDEYQVKITCMFLSFVENKQSLEWVKRRFSYFLLFSKLSQQQAKLLHLRCVIQENWPSRFAMSLSDSACFTSETKEDTEGDNQRFMPSS